MITISIQKCRSLHYQELDSISHLFTAIQIVYGDKTYEPILEPKQITNLEGLYQVLQKLDFAHEFIVKQQNNIFVFKKNVHLKWERTLFISKHEHELMQTIEQEDKNGGTKGIKQLASIVDANFNEFKIEKCIFEGDLVISGNRWVDLKIQESGFSKKFCLQNFEGKINSTKNGFQGAVEIQDFASAEKREIEFNGGLLPKLTIKNSCIEKIFFKCVQINEGIFLDNTFTKQASFYGSTFMQCPNFAQCNFEGNVNLVNTNLAFDFEDTEKQIDFASKDNDKHFVANDFRDSFRLFKNTLSKEGNVLDASNYHRVELYCKEIELDSKPQKSWRDRIDSLQLWFYRHLCNHHTDLLRVWNSLMYLIFIFGVLSFGAMAWFAYYFDDNFSLANYFDSTHLRIFYDSHIKFMIHKHPLRIWGINLGFIALFLFLFLGLTSKICRWIFVIPSYLVSIGMFAISPKLLMPAIGFFTDKREILDPLSIIGGAYTLLFGLIAYSLIKTARKNSIIPS